MTEEQKDLVAIRQMRYLLADRVTELEMATIKAEKDRSITSETFRQKMLEARVMLGIADKFILDYKVEHYDKNDSRVSN